MTDILQGFITFAKFLFDHLDHPLAGWVVGIMAILYVWWDNRRQYSACSNSLTALVKKHGREVNILRRIIQALIRKNEVARQKLIDGGLMEPEDDSEASQTLAELLYAKPDDYPVH